MGVDSTIVAMSTPPGHGGVGMVRLSGPLALSIGQRLFFTKHNSFGHKPRYVEFGHILDHAGARLDTGLAWYFQGPASYTGEDTVEISSHGSLIVLECLVQAALNLGARLAEPGEFTRRAFLNGKLDLLQAEAVVDLIQAGSRQGLADAYGLASGRLSERVRSFKSLLVHSLALVEADLDFSEEEDIGGITRQEILSLVGECLGLCTALLDTFTGAKRRQDGCLVALVGPPNAGKSTLLNTLLAEDRAIVTPLPGTTRDLVEGRLYLDGELIRLVDTAGIRSTSDPIETQGISRSKQVIAEADLCLVILDQSVPFDFDFFSLIPDLSSSNVVLAINKIDLPSLADFDSLLPINFSAQIALSAKNGEGIEALKACIIENLPQSNSVDGLVITRERHHDILTNLSQSLICVQNMLHSSELLECIADELRFSLSIIGELLGEDIREDVLDRIFSDFCIGK
jgi:tRNA modification GTPase